MGSHLAVGLQIAFVDEERGDLYARRQRDKSAILWCRAGDDPSSGESAPVVAMGPPEKAGRRAVLHPVPPASRLWGELNAGHELVLYVEREEIGSANVLWVRDMERGLQPDQLRAIVHWTSSGRVPPFSS